MFELGDTGLPGEATEFKVAEPAGASAASRKEVLELPDELPGLGDFGASREALPEQSAPIAKPVGRPEDVGIPDEEEPGVVRRVLGVVLNLALAVVLLVGIVAVGSVYLHEGRVDLSVLSPSRLQSLVAPSQSLVTRDISNGLYETREGNPLFFVRGEVENRGASAARVKVQATLYDGDQRVKSQEGLAGAVPSPEQLHAIVSTEEAAALRKRLDASATLVPPGGRVPFVLLFQEYPAELDAFRLEVTLEPVPEPGEAPRGGAK